MRTILIILFTFCCLFSNAQVGSGTPWMKNLKQSKNNPLTFKEIVDAGNTYWKTRDTDAKGSGYKPFKRWESFWQNYVNADGFLPTSQELWEVWDAKNSKKLQRRSTAVRIDESNWESMGPTDFLNRNYKQCKPWSCQYNNCKSEQFRCYICWISRRWNLEIYRCRSDVHSFNRPLTSNWCFWNRNRYKQHEHSLHCYWR